MLPVGGLKIFKVVSFVEIKCLEIFGEDNNGVTDEQMREMGGKQVVHAAVNQALFNVLVNNEIRIEILTS